VRAVFAVSVPHQRFVSYNSGMNKQLEELAASIGIDQSRIESKLSKLIADLGLSKVEELLVRQLAHRLEQHIFKECVLLLMGDMNATEVMRLTNAATALALQLNSDLYEQIVKGEKR
jgi:hypothetical protein